MFENAGILSALFVYTGFLLGLANCQEFSSNDIHRAWRNTYRSESDSSCRVARFIGFIEGAYGINGINEINSPRIWRLPIDVYRDRYVLGKASHAKIISDPKIRCREQFSEGEIFIARAGENPNQILFQLLDKTGNDIWRQEIKNMLPKLISQGIGEINGEAVSHNENILFFGRVGEIRLFTVMSKKDGSINLNFAYFPDWEQNLAQLTTE